MAAYFLEADGRPKAVGTMLRNPALAAVLRRIAREGAGALYTGSLAEAIVSQVQGSTNPGSLALSDLRGYEAKERTPVCAAYERWRVCGVPPPSAGGIAIAQILGTLQALEARDSRWSLAKLPPIPSPTLAGAEPRPEAVHLIAEADRLAYADRC